MRGYTYRELGNHGRLGNQMWQVASTIGMSKHYGGDACLPSWSYYPSFNVPPIYFDARIPGDYKNLYPDYLQDLRWIDPLGEKVFDWFSPSDRIRELLDFRWGSMDDFIGVHVRRGDYLTLPNHHPVCPIEYYEAALDELGDGPLAVVSDDVEWCRKQALFSDAVFPDQNEVEDMFTYSRCGAHVLSNGTFAWWGAFLGYNPENPRVCYPDRWYGPAVDANFNLMIQKLPWTRINFDPSWPIESV